MAKHVIPKQYLNEGDVKKAVKAILTDDDWFWWMPAANGMGTTGISDFCAVKNGVFLAVETKFGKNDLSPMQRAFLNSIRSHESFAFKVSEKNVEWLQAWIAAFNRATIAASKNEKPSPEDGATMLNALKELTDF